MRHAWGLLQCHAMSQQPGEWCSACTGSAALPLAAAAGGARQQAAPAVLLQRPANSTAVLYTLLCK